MEYLNANDVLPQKLLKEIQKYAQGKLLYVPKTEEKAWGELSGQKLYYRKRNRMIINKFQYGTSIEQIAKEYYLSVETIKKIVYSKKNFQKNIFCPDIDSAKEYSRDSLLEEWVHTYLLFERKNKGFSDDLYQKDRFYIGPLVMPLELLEINCNSPLFEALSREHIKYYPIILWCSSKDDYYNFKNKFAAYTEFAFN